MSDTQKQLDDFLKFSLKTKTRTKNTSDKGRLYYSAIPEKDSKQKVRTGYVRFPSETINNNIKCVSFILIETKDPKIPNDIYAIFNMYQDDNKIELRVKDGVTSNHLPKSKVAKQLLEHINKLPETDSVSLPFSMVLDSQKSTTFGTTVFKMVF